MWIYMNTAMLSIVQSAGCASDFLVSARFPGDIEHVFPDAAVIETNDADYRFRAFIDKRTVAEALLDALAELNYDNFKDSVSEPSRKRWYANTWNDARSAQMFMKTFPNDAPAVKPPAWDEGQ